MAPDVERRTWDKESYEARAKARSSNASSSTSSAPLPPGTTTTETAAGEKRKQLTSALHEEGDERNKEEFQPAEKGRAGPAKSQRAFLKARRNKVDLEEKLGLTEIISPEAAANSGGGSAGIGVEDGEGGAVSIKDGVTKSSTGVGWHCKVCDCYLKDSLTYLDHINGRKHQRYLGYSMRVEKSTTSEVSNKLAMLAKKKREEEEQRGIAKGTLGKRSGGENDDALDGEEEEENEFEAMVRRKDEEALRKKAERARRKEERKKKEQQEAKEEQEEGGIDPEMAAMMGFSGFGGGGANR